MATFESKDSAIAVRLLEPISRVCTAHSHLCSACRAVITVDDGQKCLSDGDHDDGLCETCAIALPAPDEFV